MTRSQVKVFAVVVLYEIAPSDSACLQSLDAAKSRCNSGLISIQTLVYDNTPGSQQPTLDSGELRYEASGKNNGLAIAYNHALNLAREDGFDWLLLLDQDTRLPLDFLESIAMQIRRYDANGLVAAVVPMVRSGGVVVSPKRVSFMLERLLPEPSFGIQNLETTAINSGTMVRCEFIHSIGGFNRAYWLDYLDHWLFRQIYASGKKVAVSTSILEHSLSVEDDRQNISISRYRSILTGESAFMTTHRSRLQLPFYLLRLLVRSVRLKMESKPDLALFTIATLVKILRHPTRALECK